MVEVFGATSTTEDVLSGVNLRSKRIFVTGVSAGLGVETARSLTAHGAHVVGAARDLTKAEAAITEVRKAAAANGGGFELIELDLASLKSVRACADGLLAQDEPFDVVIANAGVMAMPFGHTVGTDSEAMPMVSDSVSACVGGVSPRIRPRCLQDGRSHLRCSPHGYGLFYCATAARTLNTGGPANPARRHLSVTVWALSLWPMAKDEDSNG